MPSPELSVIVVAHDKKDFLLEAVKSASRQTLSRDLFEIICVKNFSDEAFDSKLSEFTDTIIHSDSSDFGEKALTAIKAASGEILCFLDYDDKFSSEKLKFVLEHFRQQKKLMYLHNGRSSNPVEFDSNVLHANLSEGSTLTLDMSLADYVAIERFFRHYPDFNSSSISIRKSILEGKEKYLNNLIMHPDTFLLFCALESGGMLMDKATVLTYYRLHQSTTNVFSNTILEYLDSNLKYFRKTESDWELIGSFITNKSVQKLCRCEMVHNFFLMNIYDLHTNRKQFFTALIDFLRCIRSRKLINMIILGLNGFAIFLLPKLGRKLYYLRNIMRR